MITQALSILLPLALAGSAPVFAEEPAGTTGGFHEGSAPSGQTGTQGQPGQPGQAAKPKAQGNVLDFEGDVIEGQKKTPEIFLQTEVERPTLDTVLYQRRHFNDFHKNDSRQRPRASDPPK